MGRCITEISRWGGGKIWGAIERWIRVTIGRGWYRVLGDLLITLLRDWKRGRLQREDSFIHRLRLINHSMIGGCYRRVVRNRFDNSLCWYNEPVIFPPTVLKTRVTKEGTAHVTVPCTGDISVAFCTGVWIFEKSWWYNSRYGKLLLPPWGINIELYRILFKKSQHGNK